MKIVNSSYKDYYDYLQGIRGIDVKVILVRKGIIVNPVLHENGDNFQFFICGELLSLYYYNKKYYTEEDLNSMGLYINRGRVKTVIEKREGYSVKYLHERLKDRDHKRYIEKNIEKYDNCPIILLEGGWGNGIKFPKLEPFNISKYYPPEIIWDKLYNWMSSIKDIPNNQTNVEKITSHGFDKITSFRPKIKEKKS